MSRLEQLILRDAGDDGVLGASLPSWTALELFNFTPPSPAATSFELPFLFPFEPESPAETSAFDLPGLFGLFPTPQEPGPPEPVLDIFNLLDWLGWS
jgi:hypothetical protein